MSVGSFVVAGAMDAIGHTQQVDEEEAPPSTQRSPSFVRVRAAASSERVTLEEAVTLEPPRAPSARRLDSQSGVRLLPRATWDDRDVELRLAALRLEEHSRPSPEDSAVVPATRRSGGPTAAMATRQLVADVSDLADVLRAIAKRHGHDLEALLSHAYEWAANLLARSATQMSGGRLEDDLRAAEYSSLFVRAILDPMLDAAVQDFARTHEMELVDALRSLRERVFWVNWTVRQVDTAA